MFRVVGDGRVGGVEIYLEELILKLREMDHEIAIGYVQTSAELSKTSYWSDDVYAYELSRLGPSGLDGLLLWGSDLICIHILLNLGIWNQFHVHRCPLASFSHSFMSTRVSASKCVCTKLLVLAV